MDQDAAVSTSFAKRTETSRSKRLLVPAVLAVAMIGNRARQSNIRRRKRRHVLEQLVLERCGDLLRFADRQVFFYGDGNVGVQLVTDPPRLPPSCG
ncbi:hypothetical protein ACWTU6_16525 [Mesorhizobium sp. BHbsci]